MRASGALALMLAAALLVACGGGSGDADLPQPASALASEPLLPDGCRERGGYCGMLTPGGQLTAAAWLDEQRMYLADLEGRIRLLNVETGELWTVRTGLSMPQGLTVLHGRLYVSDMGNVCQGMWEEKEKLEAAGMRVVSPCNLVPPRLPPDVLWEHLGRYTARVLSYLIDGKGGLDDEQVMIDRIITLDREHSPNGITSDGEFVYVSIGHPVGGLEQHLDQLHDRSLRTDLMGTIVRMDSSGSVNVYARGFRNVYGISIAPDGTIYGADNDELDGLASSGHLEELNAIRDGEFYGFPIYGTNAASPGEGVTEPVAILQGVASTATYANDDGVYVSYLKIGEDIGRVVERFDYENFIPKLVYAEDILTTAILEQNDLLYLITLEGNIHVIDPHDAPVPFGIRLSTSDLDRILSSDPTVHSDYRIYLDDSRIIYVKNSCTSEEEPFFLHVIPFRIDDLPMESREDGLENLDFAFERYGWIEGDMCVVLRYLPSYDIEYVVTGQNVVLETDGQTMFEAIWMEQLYFPVLALISEGMDRILASDPVIRSQYDVYLDDSRLIYLKNDCEDEMDSFSLHVYPVKIDDLSPEAQRQGFENLDFSFDRFGIASDGMCIALRYLPSYDIDYLTTGQYFLREVNGQTTFETTWVEELSFRE